jgi:hypothetical protein
VNEAVSKLVEFAVSALVSVVAAVWHLRGKIDKVNERVAVVEARHNDLDGKLREDIAAIRRDIALLTREMLKR